MTVRAPVSASVLGKDRRCADLRTRTCARPMVGRSSPPSTAPAHTYPHDPLIRWSSTSAQLVAGCDVAQTGAARWAGQCGGVTAFEGADCGPVPNEFVAVTRNVYVVPFRSPVMVTLVAGGLPVTVTGFCAVVPMYGVTV